MNDRFLCGQDMAYSDIVLLKRWAKSHDAEVFNEIVARYADMVYATCHRILGNAADAEEVTQECFLRLSQGGTLVHSSLGGWLHQVATHCCLDRVRAERRRKEREKRFVEGAGRNGEVKWDDVKEYVDEAIADLPEKLREPLIRHFLQRETHEAIASSLGISRQAVTQRIGNGIARIRKGLSKRGVRVSTTALAAMLAVGTAEAASLPLMASLGKVAIAGVHGPLATSTAAGGLLGTTKVAVGVAIMWKHIVLACGVIVLGLGLAYMLAARNDESPVTPTERPQAVAYPLAEPSLTEARPSKGVPAKEEAGLASPAAKPYRREDLEQAKLAAVLEELLKAYQEGVAEEPGPGKNGAFEPLSSKDTPPGNGAHYFLLAAELFPDVDLEWLFEKFDSVHTEGWTEDPALRALFDSCRDSFNAIRRGLEVGNAMMPLSQGLGQPMPYLSTFRRLAQVMSMEAQMYQSQGDYKAAFDNYAMLVDFANESSRGGAIINTLVGYSIGGVAAASLRDAISAGGAGPQDYRLLIERLEVADGRGYTMWEGVNSEVENINGWLETQLESGADLRTILGNPQGELADATEADLELLVNEILEAYQRSFHYLASPFYEARAVDSDVYLGENRADGELLPSFDELRAREAWARAETRGTLVMAAIELYREENGAYPASLDGLLPSYLSSLPKDPFTGSTFVYSLTQAGYALHSTGADMEDNAGLADDWNRHGADMVFHVDR